MLAVDVVRLVLPSDVIGCESGIKVILMHLDEMLNRVQNIVGILGVVISSGKEMVHEGVVEHH